MSACGVTKEDSVGGTSMATVPGVSIATVVASILAVLASAKSAASESKGGGSGFTGFLGKIWAKIKDPIVPWAALAAVVVIIVGVVLRWVAALVADPTLLSEWKFAGWFAVLLLATKLVTDANRTSLHHFFRERISYAFLVRRTGNGVQPVPYRRPLRFSEAFPPAGRRGAACNMKFAAGAGQYVTRCSRISRTLALLRPRCNGLPATWSAAQIGVRRVTAANGAPARRTACYSSSEGTARVHRRDQAAESAEHRGYADCSGRGSASGSASGPRGRQAPKRRSLRA